MAANDGLDRFDQREVVGVLEVDRLFLENDQRTRPDPLHRMNHGEFLSGNDGVGEIDHPVDDGARLARLDLPI